MQARTSGIKGSVRHKIANTWKIGSSRDQLFFFTDRFITIVFTYG
jgi:hypothetical protein